MNPYRARSHIYRSHIYRCETLTGVISWQKRLSVSDSVTKKPDTLVLFLGRLSFCLQAKWTGITSSERLLKALDFVIHVKNVWLVT